MAVKAFPKYIPLHLNLVQALHGYCSGGDSNSGLQDDIQNDDVSDSNENSEIIIKIIPTVEKNKLFNRANYILEDCNKKVVESHPEYKRYTQLREMMAEIAPYYTEEKNKK